jgi:hypothetical protein
VPRSSAGLSYTSDNQLASAAGANILAPSQTIALGQLTLARDFETTGDIGQTLVGSYRTVRRRGDDIGKNCPAAQPVLRFLSEGLIHVALL